MKGNFEIGKFYIHDLSEYEYYDRKNPYEIVCCADIEEEKVTNPNCKNYGQSVYQIRIINIKGEGQTLVQDSLEIGKHYFSDNNDNSKEEFAYKLIDTILSGNNGFGEMYIEMMADRRKRKEQAEKNSLNSLPDYGFGGDDE